MTEIFEKVIRDYKHKFCFCGKPVYAIEALDAIKGSLITLYELANGTDFNYSKPVFRYKGSILECTIFYYYEGEDKSFVFYLQDILEDVEK